MVATGHGARLLPLLLLLAAVLSGAQQARVGDTIGGIPVMGDDFDVDEYIKSFQKPQTPTDPEVVQAGGLLKSAKEKETEGDMDGAKADLDEAISTLRSTIDAKKLLSAGYFARGSHWAKRQKDYKATKDFTSALKFLDPINILDRAQVHYARAMARHRRKKLPGASEDLSKAVEMLQAQTISADEATRKELYGMQAGWLTMHGLVMADSGDHENAIKLHTKAIGIDPSVPSAWMNRGSAYEGQEKWDEAIADYNQRIELQPESAANAHLHRGFCRLQQDKSVSGLELAIADMQKACDGGMDFGCKNVEGLRKQLDKFHRAPPDDL